MYNHNLMKMLRYLELHELPSSMRILDTEWLDMKVITTSGNVALGVSYTFSWSHNPRISISSSYTLIVDDDLGELRGRTPIFLE